MPFKESQVKDGRAAYYIHMIICQQKFSMWLIIDIQLQNEEEPL
jgi:hypothetical protein